MQLYNEYSDVLLSYFILADIFQMILCRPVATLRQEEVPRILTHLENIHTKNMV